jgi:hypothetical protein
MVGVVRTLAPFYHLGVQEAGVTKLEHQSSKLKIDALARL